MSETRAGAGSKLVGAVAGAAAAYVARKVLFFAGTKLTGKEPPEHPEDPPVALREALIWGDVLGAGVHTARMLAVRLASGRGQKDSGGPPV